MNLFSVAERLAVSDNNAVAFDPNLCLHSINKIASCEACIKVCPVEAILPGKPPVFVTEKCAQCLACLQTCPSGAFLAKDSAAPLLNCVTRNDAHVVELLCKQNLHTDRGLPQANLGLQLRGCLAGLGAGGYLALAALGLEQVVVRLDACEECPWHSLRPSVEAQVSLAQLLLGPYHKEHIFSCTDEVDTPCEHPIWDVDNPPLSRRDLFSFAVKRGQGAIAHALERTDKGERGKPGPARMRILRGMVHLTAPSLAVNPQLPTGDFAILVVSEACTACGTCGRACPTRALQFSVDENSQTFQLNFFPRLCIGCDLCTHVCSPKAVSIDHAPSFHQVFGLTGPRLMQRGKISHCESCQTVYASRPGLSLCPVCEFRQQNLIGSKQHQGLNPAFDIKSGETQ